MPIINNPFNGKLNLDVAEYRISNGDYIDALNITKDAQGRGQDRVVSNIVGNTLIPYTLPLGTNKIIGFYPDKIRNRAYYFLWNSSGYNTILYYDLNNDTITKVLESKTDSDGIDILNFNPSYKVLSVNIFYRDDEGDILFFNDGYNPPKNINVAENYGTSWKLEYILVAKAPPIMPAKVVYENDTTVKVNNLRNKLFQFSYRYVYTNNEKSVWSSKSIVPLPQQYSLNLTNNPFTDNSRISISVNSGGLNVRDIEICFRETSNGVTSDWFLIRLFNKQELEIGNNAVFTYNFYNNSIYTQLDVVETTQLQDYVPQKANAAELANGNVLLYSGITESYDKTSMDLVAGVNSDANGYVFDINGTLLLATCNGLDSGSIGTELKICLFGTGDNGVNGIVESLNNVACDFFINVVDLTGADIGATVSSGFTDQFVSNLLNDIKSALIASDAGWSGTISNNVLTMTYPDGFLLQSSGTKINEYSLDYDPKFNTFFANAWDSGYQYALQYFDNLGRTIGAQTDIDASINTPTDNGNRFCQPYVQIKNRPPLEAAYYQLLRSNNTTYNKRLFWISTGAYSSTEETSSTRRFAYIDIQNITEYNQQISSTANVVSYNFTDGDRITFLNRYDAENVAHPIANFDYEILGTVSSIRLQDGTLKEGNFIKIEYPIVADTDPNFKFNGNENFLHYEIFLYNFSVNTSTSERFFYEFGKCFGIGNPGTANAYHIGLEQTQSASNPTGVPAIISATNGDLFYRYRNVIYNDNFVFSAGKGNSQDITSTIEITVPNTPIDAGSYIVQSQAFNNNVPGTGFSFSDTDYFFYNQLTTESINISLKGDFNIYQSATGNTNLTVTAYIVNSASVTTVVPLTQAKAIIATTPTEIFLNTNLSVPFNSKVWICISTQNDASGDTFIINGFNLYFSVLKNKMITIIESSFSDNYNLITNSNGRASVVDVNAKKTYFPTLIRFGGAYQVNTNINQINNFKYENFDEYDRSFGDVMRLHVRDRYLKVYQKFKVGNVPILTQIVKDSANNPLQANTDTLINKIQYYAGDYGIGDASTSLAWNNFSDYFVDNYRGVVCRLSQDGITPLSILYTTNAFFVPFLQEYRQELNNGIPAEGEVYTGNPCIYGVFDAYTNKYLIAMEEINRYAMVTTTTTTSPGTTTTTTSTTTTTTAAPTTTTTTLAYTSIGEGYKVLGTSDCTSIGNTPELFLNSVDYAIYVSNGGCLSNGASTVAVIRNSAGSPITGTFFFVYNGSGCAVNTFKSTNGNLTINPTQC
jgi:hypothetical protein